ncbi:uncharacterized protein M437DRAFT_68030 [Aureobasidium melanogenum CBS 110374]|uniref:Homeobox and C2H2 transcription factor n=1 Tax=Aureobasidium melanogenum (strain CBS 110374) TaxID=1043003 RepID=A0A074VMY8_AURM1|nr:uncharacterized protein M437DRAFT_68030 [Aureobasidium melanogenum CBS 110374]KEQ60484.1 hypothetical protein M437DRAFT_68030 [Aureobasidium melanogenum CBS 110374]
MTARHLLRHSPAASEILTKWTCEHRDSPYPTAAEKETLRGLTGLNVRQLNTWFANYRRRKQAGRPSKDTSATTPQLVTDAIENEPDTQAVPEQETSLLLQGKKFQCTFCTDTFSTKYDWTRHETSCHIPLKRYICCPFSAVQQCASTGNQICAYCGLTSPTSEHIASHNHDYCQSREPNARIFLRKDHLRQHLRSVHECGMLPHMDDWLLEAAWVNSRCGFCGERFTTWNERNEHLASHFRDGYHMGMWKGCRGFDGAVSAQVIAAMPPFLIDLERLRPFPFSASNAKRGPGLPQNRSWEFLVAGLHRLVKYRASQSRPVSDQDLQDEARLLTYGSSTADIHTAADNPEWLDLFKKAYSLGILTCLTEGQEPYTAEDLEVYHDLGIAIPSLSQEQRTSALLVLFQNDGPIPKAYRRFSASRVPLQKALPFETISGPWPDAVGVPKDTGSRA